LTFSQKSDNGPPSPKIVPESLKTRMKVHSSLDTSLPKPRGSQLAAFNDYTPSQLSKKKPIRSGLRSIQQNYFKPVLRNMDFLNKNKVIAANAYGHLNNSVEGGKLNKIMVAEYDNIMGSRRYDLKKESLTKSQKELINRSQQLTNEINSTRNQMNPITGDYVTPNGHRRNQRLY
jgi:hypothetical protein